MVHQGMILGEDGEKMSKSRGNVVNPDDIVTKYGADAMRLYEMFMGPLEAVKPWQTQQIAGVVRFLNRVFTLASKTSAEAAMNAETKQIMHRSIRKVTQDMDALGFNTAISQLMVFSNHLQTLEQVPGEAMRALTLLLSPMAPHLCEEVWQQLGHKDTLAYEPWPKWDEELCEEASITMAVQVNGKVKAEITLPQGANQDLAREAAMAAPKVIASIDGKEVKKFIYVPGKIVNIVAK